MGDGREMGIRQGADRFDNFGRKTKVGFLKLVGAIGLVGVLLHTLVRSDEKGEALVVGESGAARKRSGRESERKSIRDDEGKKEEEQMSIETNVTSTCPERLEGE
jgi:hypothetical protein